MKLMLLLMSVLILAGCANEMDPAVESGGADRAREIARVRAHLERVERELLASAPAGLSVAQAERRSVVISNLHRYIENQQYPTNRISEELTPIFVDGDGARCALAALLEASGHHALVARIAQTDNLAYVEQLKDDPELKAWLAENGLTVIEAARIQPSYANTVASSWQPTVSVGGSVQSGAEAELVLAPGLRVGARRVTRSNSSCDRCVHSSLALIAEYSRSIVAGGDSTNQLGVLVQYDLNDQASDHQLYLIGGPLASIDEDSKPGSGVGGQLGVGFSLRSRPLPLFAELVVSALEQARDATVRGGMNLGVVW